MLLAVLITQDMVLAGLLAALPRIFQAVGPVSRSTTSNVNSDPLPGSMDMAGQAWLVFVLAQAATAMVFLVLCMKRQLRKWQQTPARGLEALRDSVSSWAALARGHALRLESETFTLAALSCAFACSYATDMAGLSIELGAFSAGLTLASLAPEVAERVERHLQGLKDSLAALFFASIGLVINGRFLLDNLAAILSVVTFVFVLKTLTAYLPLRLIAARGQPAGGLMAIRVAAITAHVGEFGFVLAAKGAKLGVLSRHVYLLLVGANAMSLCLTPWLFRGLDWILPRQEEFQFF